MKNKKMSEKIILYWNKVFNFNLFTRKKSSKAFKIFFIQIKIELENKKKSMR